MAVARMHRIAVEANCGDLGSAPSFNRFIKPKEERAGGGKFGEQEPQEDTTGSQARPLSAVQHPMIGLK